MRRFIASPRIAFAAAVLAAGGAGLCPAGAASAADAQQAAAGPSGETVAIEGQRFPADEVIGRAVMTPQGERFGEVVDLIRGRGAYGNNVVIEVQLEDRGTGLVVGAETPRLAEVVSPVILGGSTIAVPGKNLGIDSGGGVLVASDVALMRIGEPGNRGDAPTGR